MLRSLADLLHLDVRMPGTAQQIGRWRAGKDVARLDTQHVLEWLGRVVMAIVAGEGADREAEVNLATGAFRHSGAPGQVDPQRYDRTGRRCRRAVRWLRGDRARRQQKQGNQQPHEASMGVPD
jgi:hypothetical protein